MRFEKISNGIYDNTTSRKYIDNDEIVKIVAEKISEVEKGEN